MSEKTVTVAIWVGRAYHEAEIPLDLLENAMVGPDREAFIQGTIVPLAIMSLRSFNRRAV